MTLDKSVIPCRPLRRFHEVIQIYVEIAQTPIMNLMIIWILDGVFFVTKYTKIWDEPISSRIKRLTKKYKLTWLRTEIAYSKHTCFGEKLNGDLKTTK